MQILEPTWVSGTPRGYGNGKTEDEWLDAMKRALVSVQTPPLTGAEACEVVLAFKIWPNDPAYRGHARPHGPDLDNLVKLTIDGLTPLGKGVGPPRGLSIIPDDPMIYRIVAGKEIVQSADKTGVLISISTL